MIQLTVLYPYPTDVSQFETDYANHLALLHEKAGIPTTMKPYTVTKFMPTPEGNPIYYQMFMMPFKSSEVLQATMASEAMQEVGADAYRISTGGAPLFLIGNTE